MNNRHLVAFLFAGCVLLAAASWLSAAEPRKSHRSIGSPGDLDEDRLLQRLRPTQDTSLLRTLAEKMLNDPKKFNLTESKQRLLQQMLRDPNTASLLQQKEMHDLFRDALKNPKLTPEQLDMLRQTVDKMPPDDLAKLAKQIAENPRDFNLSDEERRRFEKLAESFQKSKTPEDQAKVAELLNKIRQNPNVPPSEAEGLSRALPGFSPPEPVKPAPSPGPEKPAKPLVEEPKPPTTPPATTPKPPEPTPSATNEKAADTLLKLADWLQDVDPDDTVLEGAADLLRSIAAGEGDDAWAADVLTKGADWIGSLSSPGEWFPEEQTKKAGSLWDKISAPNMPNTGESSPNLPTSRGGSSSPFGTPSLEGLVRVLFFTALLAAGAFAAWWLMVWYRAADERRRRGIPDHWPVAPGRVATRGDLVRAFEYLALLLLGVEAKHRHHLDLADRLGATNPQSDSARKLAADHLAHLYELARYAPEDEPLPEAELAAARRDLSYLAGAAAA